VDRIAVTGLGNIRAEAAGASQLRQTRRGWRLIPALRQGGAPQDFRR
jgi:hypothetical protein